MINEFILLASGLLATTYGYNERFCGDVAKPAQCSKGAVTASGVEFDPALPQVAIAAPARAIVRPTWVALRVENGPCRRVHMVDKMNPRWIGVRGMDLTPAAVELLTGKPATPTWSGKVFVCDSGPLRVESSVGGTDASAPKDPYVQAFVRAISKLHLLPHPKRLRKDTQS